MTGRSADHRKRDAAYWADHLGEVAGGLSKPALAIGRQRLREWCALNGGRSAAELRAYLEDVQNVLGQAGVRQGVIRRPPRPSAPDDDPPPSPRPHLRLIK